MATLKILATPTQMPRDEKLNGLAELALRAVTSSDAQYIVVMVEPVKDVQVRGTTPDQKQIEMAVVHIEGLTDKADRDTAIALLERAQRRRLGDRPEQPMMDFPERPAEEQPPETLSDEEWKRARDNW